VYGWTAKASSWLWSGAHLLFGRRQLIIQFRVSADRQTAHNRMLCAGGRAQAAKVAPGGRAGRACCKLAPGENAPPVLRWNETIALQADRFINASAQLGPNTLGRPSAKCSSSAGRSWPAPSQITGRSIE